MTDGTTAAMGATDGTPPAKTRIGLGAQGGLRSRAARGTVVNTVYLMGLNFLALIKGFAVAAFVSIEDYGVWGLLGVSFATLMFLVQVGVDDKYLQQDDPDQERAFQEAFTLQLAVSGAFVVLILLVMPLYGLAYGNWDVVLPGYVLVLAMPAVALQAPLWTFYRRMDYLQQRKLQAFDPVVSLVVTVALAAAGLGYWSLVIGVVCGSWAAAIAAIRAAPYPIALRYRGGTARDYVRFSGPLFLSSVNGVLVAQVPILIAQRSVGLAGVGAITIAATISAYANRVDDIVTDTLYPAVCAVQDRIELLREAFLKSNRIALLWAMPMGVGVALFAPDLVHRVLGDRWEGAIFVIQAFGVMVAINQIGFNWTAFFRARSETRPIAVASAALLVAVGLFAVPLLLIDGIDGYAVGMCLATIVMVIARLFYLARLFDLRSVLLNTARAALPTVPALAAALAARALGPGSRGLGQVVLEGAIFVVVAAAVTLRSERLLIREFLGYLRPAPAPPSAAA